MGKRAHLWGTKIISHLGETRKINKGEVEDIGRVDLEVDRELGHAFVLTGHPECLVLNFFTDLCEICEALVQMKKLSVFSARRQTGSGGWMSVSVV